RRRHTRCLSDWSSDVCSSDLTEDLVWPRLDVSQQLECHRTGSVTLPSKYDPSGYAYALGLFEDGRRHLIMRDEIPLLCPVRLLRSEERRVGKEWSLGWARALY